MNHLRWPSLLIIAAHCLVAVWQLLLTPACLTWLTSHSSHQSP